MSLHDEIAKAAYELYEKNGRVDGSENENWLEAEKIVLARNAQRAKPNEEKRVQTAKLQPQSSVGAKAKMAKV